MGISATVCLYKDKTDDLIGSQILKWPISRRPDISTIYGHQTRRDKITILSNGVSGKFGDTLETMTNVNDCPK